MSRLEKVLCGVSLIMLAYVGISYIDILSHMYMGQYAAWNIFELLF